MVSNENDFKNFPEKPKGFGFRHYQALLMFTGLTFSYFLRVNMSSAIVAMVSNSTSTDSDHYEWDSSTKSLILSSFFWGYVLAQVPSSVLAQKFGPKIVLAGASFLCALFTMAVPFGASLGDWIFVCCLRVLVGFCQGAVYPCVHTLLSKWAPRTERGFLSTFIYSGAQIGTVIMLAISGSITESFMGWPGIFYFSGVATILWAVAYFIFGANSPSEAKKISTEEQIYIEFLTGNTHQNHIKTPWKSVFTSIPFIALIFAHCGFNWGFYTLLTQIPSYMNSVLGLDMQANSLLSSVPYLTMWTFSLIFSRTSDFLINRGVTSVGVSRKIFNTIGNWIPAVALIALGYMTAETKDIAVVLLTIAVGFNSASYLGYLVNHMDLSPNFAGTLMGISNGLSNVLSIFAPIIVGGIVPDENDASQWRIVFFITAIIYFICNFIFILFGKATVQKWNDGTDLSIISSQDIKEENLKDKV